MTSSPDEPVSTDTTTTEHVPRGPARSSGSSSPPSFSAGSWVSRRGCSPPVAERELGRDLAFRSSWHRPVTCGQSMRFDGVAQPRPEDPDVRWRGGAGHPLVRRGLRPLPLVDLEGPCLGPGRLPPRRAAAEHRGGRVATRHGSRTQDGVVAPGDRRRGPFGRGGGVTTRSIAAGRSADRMAGRPVAAPDGPGLPLRGSASRTDRPRARRAGLRGRPGRCESGAFS